MGEFTFPNTTAGVLIGCVVTDHVPTPVVTAVAFKLTGVYKQIVWSRPALEGVGLLVTVMLTVENEEQEPLVSVQVS